MQSLAWGIPDVIPDDATAAWGARAILKMGAVDLVGDRQDARCPNEPAKKAFFTWLDDKAVPWLNREAKNFYGNERRVHAFDEGVFHLRADTQASYGYLYITAWTTSAAAD